MDNFQNHCEKTIDCILELASCIFLQHVRATPVLVTYITWATSKKTEDPFQREMSVVFS